MKGSQVKFCQGTIKEYGSDPVHYPFTLEQVEFKLIILFPTPTILGHRFMFSTNRMLGSPSKAIVEFLAGGEVGSAKYLHL